MNQIMTIFKKELLDTLRDRRTLMIMIVIPMLLFPMILIIVSKVQGSANDKEMAKELRVGYLASADDFGLRAVLSDTSMHFKLVEVADTTAMKELIRKDSLDLGVALFDDFVQAQRSQGTGKVHSFYLGSKEIPRERLKAALMAYQARLVSERLDSLGISQAQITPVEIVRNDVATIQETFGKLAGGFLPYIFVAFCFMGCMFPAIDLFTGEKERGSIETILSTPVDRWKILVGKMSVVVLSGFSTAFLSLMGLYVGMQLTDALPDIIVELVNGILTPAFILSFLGMLLPMVIFFAGVMIPATIYAKSFKEAQSILTPMNFFVVTPAIVGMLPGVELNAVTALVPVLNVVLATKELMAGTMNYGLYLLVLGVLLALAAAAVTFSFKRFGDEKNILRT